MLRRTDKEGDRKYFIINFQLWCTIFSQYINFSYCLNISEFYGIIRNSAITFPNPVSSLKLHNSINQDQFR